MKKYITLKIPLPILSKTTMCGILLIVFALYNIFANFYFDGFDSYFRIIINAFMLITTAVIFFKSEDIPKNHSPRFKIIAHIVMFTSILILPLVIHLLLEGLKTTEPSSIFVFISNIFFTSRSANDFVQFLWNGTLIPILISIIIALISVYKYGFVHIPVIFHAIVNIAFAGVVSRLLNDTQAMPGRLESISSGFPPIIFICMTIAVLAIIIPIVFQRMIHHLK